jgi:hypothetical protein
MDYLTKFNAGLSYDDFLNRYAQPDDRRRWDAVHAAVALTAEQREILAAFTREMRAFVLAGAWCGDCVNQCPIFAHFAAVCPPIKLRFFDRDDHPDLGERLAICGAPRVPAVLFVSEDGYPCGTYGDRTLARYRQMGSTQLGPACPTGIASSEPTLLAQVVQEWLNEFERIQWMLRLSARLRQLHGD